MYAAPQYNYIYNDDDEEQDLETDVEIILQPDWQRGECY